MHAQDTEFIHLKLLNILQQGMRQLDTGLERLYLTAVCKMPSDIVVDNSVRRLM